MQERLLRSHNRNPPPRDVFQSRGRTDTEEAELAAVLGLPAPPPHSQRYATLTSSSDASTSHVGFVGEENSGSTPRAAGSVLEEWLQEQDELKRIFFGKPFARETLFWCVHLPAAVVLGSVVGCLSALFVGVSESITDYWILPQDVERIWVVSILGGVVTSGLLACLNRPLLSTPGSSETNSMEQLEPLPFHLRRTVLLSLAGFVALVSGAPVGPELVLSLLATTLATLLASALPHLLCVRPSSLTPGSGEEDPILEQQQRLQHYRLRQQRIAERTKLVQVGIAAAVTPFVPSPILGPVLAAELARVTSPETRFQATSSPSDQDTKESTSCDGIEHFFLSFCGSLMSRESARTVQSLLGCESMMFLKPMQDISYEYQHWHILVAVLVGILCGLLSLLGLIVSGGTRWWRRALCHSASGLLIPMWMVPLALPIVACVGNALMAHLSPYMVGTGLGFIQRTIVSVLGPTSVEGDGNLRVTAAAAALEHNQRFTLVLTALVKVVGMAISTNLGIVGGSVIPLVFCGCCLGYAMGNFVANTPVVLTLVCAMMATPFSICPFPASVSIAVLTMFPTASNLAVPVMVSCLASRLVVGGLGIQSILFTDQPNMECSERGVNNLDEEGRQQQIEEQTPSAEEILNNIRMAIFGC